MSSRRNISVSLKAIVISFGSAVSLRGNSENSKGVARLMKALPYACSIWRKVASSRGEIRCGNRQLEDQLHPGAAAPSLAVSFPSSYVQIFLVHHVSNPFEKSKTKV